LNNKGIEFEDIPLDSDPQLRSAVMDRSSRHTVPQIWIGDDHLGGFTELRDLDMQGGLDSLISTGG
jgi:glutaredoxin 3